MHETIGRDENLDGWLTTVIGRVCLDVLRSRESLRMGHGILGRAARSSTPRRNCQLR